MSKKNFDRRSILKGIGAGTAGASILGSIPGMAAAGGQLTDFEIRELDGARKDSAVRTARASDDFHRLVREMHVAEPIRIDNTEARVFEIDDPDGTPHQMVSFLMPGVSGGNRNRVDTDGDVVAFLEAGSYSHSAGTVVEYENEVPLEVRTYNTEGGALSTASETVDLDVDPSDLADLGVTENADGTFSFDPSGDVVAADFECWACKTVGDVICALGCWAGGTIICGSATIVGSPISGTLCAAIVAAFCLILRSASEEFLCASCGGDFYIEWTCHYAGYCTEPDTICNS